MKHSTELRLDPDIIAHYNALLQRTTQDPNHKRDSIIEVWTVAFSTKPGFEVDIKVINGCIDSGPYIDPVLFDEGSEITTIDIADQLDREYVFSYDGEEFRVTVSAAA